MRQVTRAPLATQAAELLLARIRNGEWSLGAKLPGETTLAPQLGVGRSTVREAIRLLAGKGVLEPRQGSGVFVIALDAVEEWDAVLARAGIIAVIEARVAIECEAASLAAERRSPQALRVIRRTLAARDAARAMGGDARDIEAYVDADMRFHRAIVEASGNPVLLELFDAFVPRLRRAMVDFVTLGHHDTGDDDHAAHEQLADAIGARDSEAARGLSRDHLESLKATAG